MGKQSAAIRAIDEELFTRGHLSLIAGQPLHPMKPQSKHLLPKTRVPTQPMRRQPMGHPRSHQALYRFAQTYSQAQNVPSSSTLPERALAPTSLLSTQYSSPIVKSAQKETVQANGNNRCPVCQRSPVHLAKDCPAIKADSKGYVRY